jgi:lipoate---protein ligase
MLIVERPQTDPYFNLAAEEYLLKNMEDDCFMLWQNEPSVIIGKHQNALAEINLSFIREKGIPVVRRISGGGTVYHDLGNLNFSFIQKGRPGKLVDFSRFLKPITEVLKEMGLPAKHEGNNDIRVNGLKISGNSEHVHRNKVLHHGTLLFNTDLAVLGELLHIKQGAYKDKSVQSVRSQVANISDFIKYPLTIQQFHDRIINFMKQKEKDLQLYSLSIGDVGAVNRLSLEKYQTWKWNFGYSPDYIFKNKIIHQGSEYSIEMEVRRGIIHFIQLYENDKIALKDNFIKNLFIGANHNIEELEERIIKLNLNAETLNFDPNILLQLLFK